MTFKCHLNVIKKHSVTNLLKDFVSFAESFIYC